MNSAWIALLMIWPGCLPATAGCEGYERNVKRQEDAEKKVALKSFDWKNRNERKVFGDLVRLLEQDLVVYFEMYDVEWKSSYGKATIRRTRKGFRYLFSGREPAITAHHYSSLEGLFKRISPDYAQYMGVGPLLYYELVGGLATRHPKAGQE